MSHLCHSQIYEGHRETLLRFLDEVFTAVAAEPYEYTDIVIDMQAEAVAQQASAVQLGVESTEWNWSSDARFDWNIALICIYRYHAVGKPPTPCTDIPLKVFSSMRIREDNHGNSVNCLSSVLPPIVFYVKIFYFCLF